MNLKAVYLKARACRALNKARTILQFPNDSFFPHRIEGDHDLARDQLALALHYARQLPDCPKYRAMRSHIVAALEAMGQADD